MRTASSAGPRRLFLAVSRRRADACSDAAGRPPTIKPGDNLVVEGVPPIPASLAEDGRPRTPSSGRPGFIELAPDAARDADRDPIRQHEPGPPREVPRRRAHADDLLSRPRAAAAGFEPEDRRLLRLLQGHGRQRVLPALPLRLRRRERHAADRRQVAQHRRALVERRPVDRLRLDAAHRQRRRHLRRRTRRTRSPTGASCELKGGGWEVADWSPDDTKLLVAEGISINETYLWLVGRRHGQRRRC